MNKILPAGWGGHAVIRLSCCTMGNLTHDIFEKIRQPLSSSHQKHQYSTCTDLLNITFKTKNALNVDNTNTQIRNN